MPTASSGLDDVFRFAHIPFDLFENGDFNMERLKPIDILTEVKRPNINMRRFRTLDKKEKSKRNKINMYEYSFVLEANH